jgi:hypothetical protein
MEIVNTGVLKNPMNWLTVLTMVALGSFALHFGLQLVHGSDALLRSADTKHPSRTN